MRHTLACLFTFVMAVASTGCLRSTTAIDLRSDGSGTIVQETGISSQALAMMKNFGGANQAGEAPPELFSEEQARKTAATMGVTFVSGEPFKTAELEGYRARFSFDDISKVKVSMGDSVAGSTGGNSKQAPFSFGFDRGATASALTIQMPDQMPGGAVLPGMGGGATATPEQKAQAAQALTMMKMMMAGLFVDVALNVDGKISKTNAPHVEGSRVTLLQIDFDKLVADESALERLQSATELKGLANIPGLKIVSEPKVTIEFTR